MNIQDIRNTKLNFILSTDRTGSTLLTAMLNMSDEILAPTEEPFAFNLYPKYKNITKWTDETIEQFCYDFYLFSEKHLAAQFGKYTEFKQSLIQHKKELDVNTAIKLAYLNFFPSKNKSQINMIVDKQLKFHFFLEEVAEMYPKAKYVVLLRDPRDNALVKWKRAKKQNEPASYINYAFNWKNVYSTLINKSQNIGTDRFLFVKYEDLVSKPEDTLREICAFLGTSYVEQMKDYYLAYHDQIHNREHDLSIGVKKHLNMFHEGLTQKVNTDKVGVWKKEMTTEEANLVWTECREWAIKAGYEQDQNFLPVKKSVVQFFELMRYKMEYKWYPNLYYTLPYFLKYWIKKLKYGPKMKNDFYKTDEFLNQQVY